MPSYWNCILVLFVPAWNIALISVVLHIILLFLIRLNQRLFSWLMFPPWSRLLTPLSLRRKVASLSLFYRCNFSHCSEELAACIPPPMARPRSTRQASFAHSCCVELSNERINRFSDSFFPSTPCLWSSLPSVFPASFNLSFFKRQVYHHLGTRWHDFFITVFRYFMFLFYSFHCLSFPFPRDADSRKGALCPFCVPIH